MRRGLMVMARDVPGFLRGVGSKAGAYRQIITYDAVLPAQGERNGCLTLSRAGTRLAAIRIT